MESVYRKIKSGALDFPHPYWTNISEEGEHGCTGNLFFSFESRHSKLFFFRNFVAKDLIRNLLNVAPHERFSASIALEHPWIKGVSMAYSEEPLSSAIMEMKRFNQKRRFN